ncbi:Metalloendoproteinase [Actinidia chinensis var. chinensis]|uniref:Metalloendoproteinase n=1 Tax=Actinidia chinensis var. chinensis TaxID=1590841 RepID=A0A2R6RYU4_ACTCC|nr:Metalloendoproteinase [Actinidia chinensis var. chinensis]
MESKFFQLCFFILLLLSVILPFPSHANPSEPKAEKPSPFEYIKHFQGCHKGEKVESLHQLKTYLEHFGYLNYQHSPNQTHVHDDNFEDLLESAIKTYQLNYRLRATGILDAETVSKMMAPRCGFPDIINGTNSMQAGKKKTHHIYNAIHTVSHYSLFPGLPRWPASQTHLTYFFLPGTDSQAMSAVTRAFSKWGFATHFIFSETLEYEKANMKISFHRRDHGDGYPFDGPGGVIAHSWAPRDGRCHFDTDEPWAFGAVAGSFDLESVALHEIGHLLGLGHSSEKNAIMYASIAQGVTRSLHEDDIQGIKALYNVDSSLTVASSQWTSPPRIKHQTPVSVSTALTAKLQILRSDNGGEYVNLQFCEYFYHYELIYETSCSQTPQQNGIAERKNRHILETTRVLLLGAHVASSYWPDANTTVVHLINQMPSKVLEFQTSLQTLSTYVTLPTALMLLPRTDTFFSPVPNSSLQRETRDEELNWLRFSGTENMETIAPTTTQSIVEELIAKESPEAEIVSLLSSVPNDPSLENIIEVSSPTTPLILQNERKYILDLLLEVGLLECKPANTPIVQNHKLGEYPDQIPIDKRRYERLVGKLIYLSHTRPDIAYAVSVVSQFMYCPSEDHMDVVIQILKYLKSSPRKGLMFSKSNHLRIEGNTDADWAGNISDRKSTSGYFTFFGGNLVTWRSKKQKVVALSSAEAKFRGMAKGLYELLWLKRLLIEIGFTPNC